MSNRFENKVRILDLVREQGHISRPVLSKTLCISLPTISNLTKELLDAQLICGAGFEKSDGGRRAEFLTINPGFATALGLELSLTGMRGVLADLGGNVLDRLSGPDRVPDGRQDMIEALLALAQGLTDRAPANRKPVGVGLSIAGLTDENGRISRKFPRRDDWKDVPLAELLEQRLGLPTLLENDVQAATLAERRHGAARGARNMLYLHIGCGIACGIVVDGRLYVGATRNAGEFGHTIVEPNGPICHCGNYGCLESLASPAAVLEQALQGVSKGVQSRIGTGADAAAIFRAADEGDRLATNVITRAAEYIGLGLANLVNFSNPELIVFGGEVLVRGYRTFNETIERTFRARVLPILQQTTRIQASQLGTDAPAVGGSMLIFEDLFDQPRLLFELAEGKPHVPRNMETRRSNSQVGDPFTPSNTDSERRSSLKESEQSIMRWRRWGSARTPAK